jgi:Flp pilus assembly protein TadG
MRRRERESGYVIVTVAILLVALMGFGALALDVGLLYSQRTSSQRAADAGALAGAFSFVVDTTAPQPSTAEEKALATTVANTVTGEVIEASQVTVTVDVAARRVTVDVAREEATFLARVLGIRQAMVRVQAVAEASPTASGAYCVKPWFIPNTVFGPTDPCDTCATGNVLVSGGEITPYAQEQFGRQFVLKPQRPSGSMAPGQFYAIQMPGSQGGAEYRSNIATCITQSVVCAELYSVETGNMVGPTVQGVRDLIGDPPEDTYIAPGEYRRGDGTISDTSRGLVIAPIWDACNMSGFCPGNQFPSGTNVSLQVVGFAMVFLEGVQGNDVIARLINVTACSGGGSGISPDASAPYSIPVRLIRTE